jgi:hypothetical protein
MKRAIRSRIIGTRRTTALYKQDLSLPSFQSIDLKAESFEVPGG